MNRDLQTFASSIKKVTAACAEQDPDPSRKDWDQHQATLDLARCIEKDVLDQLRLACWR
jgi:hypothetical protein